MRRTLAVIVLIAITWPHIMVMGCALGPAPSHHAHDVSVLAHHAHDGPQCQALMTCNPAMIDAAVTEVVGAPPTPPLLHPRYDVTAPSAAVLPAEPPPPRLSA